MQIAIYESLKKLMLKLGYTYKGNEREDDPVWATHHESGFKAMMEYLCGVVPHHIAIPTKVQDIHPNILNHPDFELPVPAEAEAAVEEVKEEAPAPAPAPAEPPAPPVVEAPAPAPAPAAVVEEIKQQFEAEQTSAPAEEPAAAPAAEQPQQEQPAAQEGSSAQE